MGETPPHSIAFVSALTSPISTLPLTDLLPLRAAAGGGSIDGLDASRLVAAGFTLLQRSVPLVRALAGRRAGILLPNSAHYLTALAASDGRGAVLLPADSTADEVASLLARHDVGAVFTLAAFADRVLDAAVPRVLLDDSPSTALVIIAPGDERRVDLGSHFGLELSGDVDAPGREEECVLIAGVAYSHRALLESAHRVLSEPVHPHHGEPFTATREFWQHDGLVGDLIVPLVAGARIATVSGGTDARDATGS